MDTITHGIAGALIGKGFFSRRAAKVAVFSATVRAIVPDVDVVAELFSRVPLAIVKYHRAITHSFLALPFVAAILAWLTISGVEFLKGKYPRFHDLESPSWSMLTVIYGLAIPGHFLLTGLPSSGPPLCY